MVLFVDKLKIANILVRGDLPRAEAEEFAETISETVESAATNNEVETHVESRLTTEVDPIRSKVDFIEVSTDQKFQAMLARSDARFAEMQAQMDTRFAEMDARFAETHAQMRIMQADFDARMAKMEVRIYRAIGVATALIIGAMSAWAAFG